METINGNEVFAEQPFLRSRSPFQQADFLLGFADQAVSDVQSPDFCCFVAIAAALSLLTGHILAQPDRHAACRLGLSTFPSRIRLQAITCTPNTALTFYCLRSLNCRRPPNCWIRPNTFSIPLGGLIDWAKPLWWLGWPLTTDPSRRAVFCASCGVMPSQRIWAPSRS